MFIFEGTGWGLTINSVYWQTARDNTVCEATLLAPCSFDVSIPIRKTLFHALYSDTTYLEFEFL